MKKSRMIFLCLSIILCIAVQSFSQAPDTALVNVDADGLNYTLAETIMGDTTVTGERNNPNRTYQLKRGGIYLLSGQVVSDYHLSILGEENPEDTKPPIIMLLTDVNSESDSRMFTSNGDFTAKNIYFLNTDDLEGEDKMVVQAGVDSVKIVLDNCVTEFGKRAVYVQGNYVSTFITNCVFRNFIEIAEKLTPYHPVIHFQKVPSDTVWIENNTFMNVGSSPFSVGKNLTPINYFYFNHNTIMNSGMQCFHFYYWTNAVVTNNLFYNVMATGDPYEQRTKQLTDANAAFSVFPTDTIGNDEIMPEADRLVKLSNNNYSVHAKVRQMWNDSSAVTGSVTFLNSERDSLMFANDATWPGLDMDWNTLYDEQPGFVNPPDNLDNFVTWAGKMITRPWVTDSPQWVWDDPDNPLLITWPLPENLSYTNATLLNGAEGGLPVGDLNWFPDKYDEWLTSVDSEHDLLPSEFTLTQNYPNPFNPTTVIGYKLNRSSVVTLNVYNLMGQKIRTLMNEIRHGAGDYSVHWNGLDDSGCKVASGVYIYRLEAGKQIQTRKMVFTQ